MYSNQCFKETVWFDPFLNDLECIGKSQIILILFRIIFLNVQGLGLILWHWNTDNKNSKCICISKFENCSLSKQRTYNIDY